MAAPVRDKGKLSSRLGPHPLMSMLVTDHRPADVSSFDSGFGKLITYRHLFGGFLTGGAVIMYASVRSGDPNGGCVFTVTMDKELVDEMRAMREIPAFSNTEASFRLAQCSFQVFRL